MADQPAPETPPEETPVDPAVAREFLGDFVDADTIQDSPDEDVLALHERYSKAVAKHAPKGDGAFPEKWRENYVQRVKGDEKLLTRMKRYAGPEAALDALVSLQNRIGTGELRSQLSPDAKPDEVTRWRTENGIPEKPGAYEISLRDGLVPGEDDKPIVDTFLDVAHKANYYPQQVNAALDWYYDEVERQAGTRHQADEELRVSVEDQLRAEWGTEFTPNKLRIESYLDTFPAGVKDAILGARAQDGQPLASNLDVLRGLVEKALEFDPKITIVPGEGAAQQQSLYDEIKAIKVLMGAPKGSESYNKYWKDTDLQARYRKLQEAATKIDEKAKKALP